MPNLLFLFWPDFIPHCSSRIFASLPFPDFCSILPFHKPLSQRSELQYLPHIPAVTLRNRNVPNASPLQNIHIQPCNPYGTSFKYNGPQILHYARFVPANRLLQPQSSLSLWMAYVSPSYSCSLSLLIFPKPEKSSTNLINPREHSFRQNKMPTPVILYAK